MSDEAKPKKVGGDILQAVADSVNKVSRRADEINRKFCPECGQSVQPVVHQSGDPANDTQEE